MEQPDERLIRNIAPPVREEPIPHRCLCVLLLDFPTEDVEIVDGKACIVRHTQTMRDACVATHLDPDSPLCPSCMAAGHLDLPHVSYTEVQATRIKQEGSC